MFPDSLSRSAQLHVPFEASLHLSDSNFHFSEQKKEGTPHLCLSSTECSGRHGEKKQDGTSSIFFPVEMSCSCDHCPSKVRLQRCIFSSDGSQDRQIMRSLPFQSQRMHCVWLRDRQWDHISLTSDCGPLTTVHFNSQPVSQNNILSGKEIISRNT